MRSAFIASLIVVLAFSGCTGDPGEPAVDDPTQGTAISVGDPHASGGPGGGSSGPGDFGDGVEVIDGSSGSLACAPPGTAIKVDPNRTYEGGAHLHDDWGGQKEIVIFDDDVRSGFIDMKDAVVLPGTGRVDFKLDWTDDVALLPETRTLTWEMPGDGKGAISYTHTFETKKSNHSIPVNLSNNDPPHYRHTTWRFKVDAEPTHLTVTITRGYDCLPIDPPHYDLWAGATQKVLSTTIVKVAEESLAVCAAPADLCSGLRAPGGSTLSMAGKNTSVPPGASRVEVVASWKNDYGYPVEIRIEYQTASTSGQYTEAAAHWKRPTSAPRQVSTTSQAFDIAAGPEDWDSPYDTESLWRFKWFFDSTGTNAALGDSGLFKGEITFVFTAFKE